MTNANSERSLPDSMRYWHSETESFQLLLTALETSLELDPRETDLWRKLAHIRFVTCAAKGFLDRLFASEECEHQSELSQHPEFQNRVADLRHDHVVLRGDLSHLLFRLDHACCEDHVECQQIFEALRQLIGHIQQHMHREINLLQDSVEVDLGGEG